MHTDELRAELAELAREVDEFPQDLGAIRNRVARRRAVLGSIAVVVSIALVVAVITTTHSGSSRVNIAGTEKEVVAANLPHLDAVVVLPAGATEADAARVQSLLDNAGSVEKYATLPDSILATLLSIDQSPGAHALRTRVCAAPSTRAYAVELSPTLHNPFPQLSRVIGNTATVWASHQPRSSDDVDAFMRPRATAEEVASVRTRLETDPQIASFRFFSHQDSLTEFKKLFANQPELIKQTKASDLPESFRIVVRGASPQEVARRLRGWAGVEQVNTPAFPDWDLFATFSLSEACSR